MRSERAAVERDWEAQLEAWRVRLGRLRVEADRLEGEPRRRRERLLADLEANYRQASERSRRLKEATDEAWDRQYRDARSVWDDVRAAFAEGE